VVQRWWLSGQWIWESPRRATLGHSEHDQPIERISKYFIIIKTHFNKLEVLHRSLTFRNASLTRGSEMKPFFHRLSISSSFELPVDRHAILYECDRRDTCEYEGETKNGRQNRPKARRDAAATASLGSTSVSGYMCWYSWDTQRDRTGNVSFTASQRDMGQ
jgi:hypothetical protein